MNKKECPSCAMEIDKEEKICPVCGFEFPDEKPVIRWLALALILMFLAYFIFNLLAQ